MRFHVELTARADQDLRRIYLTIHAYDGGQAQTWFKGIEAAVLSLYQHPSRGAMVAEPDGLRQIFYGRGRHLYRIIYALDEPNRIVTVLNIRHGARNAFEPDDP